MKEEIELCARQTLKRACGIILPLAVLSVLIAGVVVSVANDMYAFVKKDLEVSLEISASETLEDIAEKLGRSKVLNNPDIFVAYVKSKGAEGKIKEYSGNITLNSNMSYRQIVSEFSKNKY